MENKDLRVLYVSHRYHTNQVPVMRGWNNLGAKVGFWATYEGAVESHEAADYHLLKPSFITKLFNKWADHKYDSDTAERVKSSRFIPQLIDVVKQMRKLRPTLIVLRNFSLCNMKIIAVARMLGYKNIVMYVQTPLYGTVNKPNFIKKVLLRLFFPRVCFTPVYYKGESNVPRVKNNYRNSPQWFVPLVYETTYNVREVNNIIKILDVGKYRDYKNHFFLVDAISHLPKELKYEVSIIGQLSDKSERDYYSKLSQYIQEKGLSDRITLYGNISYSEMQNMYRKYDILVLPSKEESAGMVVLEGLANGLCVLCGKGVGLGSYLNEYECGFTFSTNNTDEIVQQLTTLITTPHMIKEYGRRGVDVIKEKCSFDNYLRAMNEITEKEYGLKLI